MDRPTTTPATPRRASRGSSLLLALLVVALYWPAGAYWQSDDFIAIEYSADAGRAWSDWFGNQYGLTGVVWFWRPLVTLSFWLEQALAGGPSPWLSHATNLLLHVAASLAVASLGTRLAGARAGWLAGLVWAAVPAHAGAVWWAVGRVDGLATLAMLLAARAFVRHLDRGAAGQRTSALPWLALTALALTAKESALAAPLALAWLGAATGDRATRVRRALASWPAWALLAGYLAVRFAALGVVLGGYDHGTIDPAASLTGLGRGVGEVLVPLAARADHVTLALGLAPFWIALVVLARRRRLAEVLVALAAFLALAVPTAPLWSQLAAPMNQRLLHAALVPVALVLGRCGVVPVLLVLASWVPAHIEARREQSALSDRLRTLHVRLAAEAAGLDGDAPLFVAGLPRASASGRFAGFHLGVDRLLAPPFATAPGRAVYALRTLDQREDALALPLTPEAGLPWPVTTLRVADDDRLVRVPPAGLPALELVFDGPTEIATRSLLDLDAGRVQARLRTRGVRGPWYRVTLFAASGYLSCVLPDRAAPGDADGMIEIVELLRARYVTSPGPDTAHVLFALGIATTFDRDLRFPLLVEAGTLADPMRPTSFVATHANRELARLGFDRELARFLAGGR
ncbi:MAG: hypothetical protein IT457_12000 [Planctomycetes bacterium]|nr:hypothetical protein [Planctomycetota bacterium]